VSGLPTQSREVRGRLAIDWPGIMVNHHGKAQNVLDSSVSCAGFPLVKIHEFHMQVRRM